MCNTQYYVLCAVRHTDAIKVAYQNEVSKTTHTLKAKRARAGSLTPLSVRSWTEKREAEKGFLWRDVLFCYEYY